MILHLKLKPGLTVCDFGAGCGLTSNMFAKIGCSVTGYDPKKFSLDIAEKYAKKIGVSARVKYVLGHVNDLIGDQKFDRLHTGYMLNEENALKYVDKNLNNGGVAVMNVGGENNGAVYIFTKDEDGEVKKEHSGLNVIFSKDLKP